jgi:hypothetical protein
LLIHLILKWILMTSFKRFESKPVVKIILIYDRLNLWHHRQFITIFYQFLHIRIEIIHRSHMYIIYYILFIPVIFILFFTIIFLKYCMIVGIYCHNCTCMFWHNCRLTLIVTLQKSRTMFAYARGKTLWHKGLPVVKTIYTYGFHELFLK